MHYDGTIYLGNIISLAGAVAAVLGAYIRIAERLVILETKMEILIERRHGAR